MSIIIIIDEDPVVNNVTGLQRCKGYSRKKHDGGRKAFYLSRHHPQFIISTCWGVTVIKLFFPHHPHFIKKTCLPPPPHGKSWSSPK